MKTDTTPEIDFKRICDNLKIALFIADTDGRTVYVNPAYLEKTGLKEEDLLGKTINELQKQRIIQCDIIPRMLSEGKPLNDIGYVIPTDYRAFVAGIPVRDDEGNIVNVMTTDWDVSSIMEMENRLQRLKSGSTDTTSMGLIKEDVCDEILYVSDEMRELMMLAKTVAQTDVAILITGETGTGKELLSDVIVKAGGRANKPFVKINCAAIPTELIESELFGYEEGAFTGARKGGKTGAFEQANGGTLMLDEIGELPYQVQAKLLRALQEREIVRVGGHTTIKLDLRIIAATNRNLQDEIQKGHFREDLYYRLNIIQLRIPPLRERREDIPYLAGSFLEEYCKKYNKHTELAPGVLRILRQYDWPGNVRELKNLMERLVILSGDIISVSDVQNTLKDYEAGQLETLTLKDAVARFEKNLILDALKECGGNKSDAAEMLGVERTTLVRKCQRYDID